MKSTTSRFRLVKERAFKVNFFMNQQSLTDLERVDRCDLRRIKIKSIVQIAIN